MKKKFTFLMAAIVLLSLIMPSLALHAQTKDGVTYTFTNKSWSDSSSAWGCDKAGSSFESSGSARGVQVQAKDSGAGATRTVADNNISRIDIWVAKSSSGAGNIVVKVGSTTVKTITSFSNSSTQEYVTFDTPVSGKVSVVVTCTSNSLYVKSVKITTISNPTLTINSPTGGTIAVANGTTPVSTGSTVSPTTILTLSNTPAIGYSFSSWSVFKTGDESEIVTVTNNQFEMPNYNTTVNASFNILSYNVSIDSEAEADILAEYGENNTLENGEDADIDYGTEITLIADVDVAGGKMFAWNVTKNDDSSDVTSSVLSDVEYDGATLTVPAYAITISGTVEDIPIYTITVNDPDHGTVISNKDTAEAGETITLTITPETGYLLSLLTITKEESGTVTPTIVSNTATFLMPADNVTIEAIFVEPTTATINFENALPTYAGEWIFSNIYRRTNTKGIISAHGGSSYGNNSTNGTSGTSTAYIQTLSKIAQPMSLTFYISKESNNTTSSTWYIQTSTDGSNWENCGSIDATTTTMNSGAAWLESTTNLSSYSNVYVRIYYTGSTALRAIDDVSLTYIPAPPCKITVNSVEHITIKATAGATEITEGNHGNAAIGTTVTLSCPDHYVNYRIKAWSVYKDGDPTTTVTVTNNSFTMPDYNVIVSAITEETRTITYNVNGTTTNTVVVKGTPINPIPDPDASNIPDGYEFLGWTDDKSKLEDEDFITSYTANDGKVFYAVLKKSFTLVPSDFGTYSNDTKTLHGIEFTYENVGTYSSRIQFKSGSGFLYNTQPLNNLQSIVITRGDAYKVTVKAGDDAANLTSASAIEPSTSGSIDTYDVNNKKYVLLTQNSCVPKCLRIEFVFSNYNRYTNVVPETVTDDITISEPTYVASGSVVDMGSYNITCNNAANLIIEDGAEIILNSANTGVKATFIKNITSAAKDNDIWYTISTPIGGINITDVTNLVDNEGHTLKYNLYRYNESLQSNQWEAYNPTNHDDFTTLVKGKGYLYRNNGKSLSFAGEVNVGNVTGITLTSTAASGDLRGFNLIGNPFGHTIYKGEGAAIDNTSLNEGFYYLTETGEWIAGDYKTPITPRMGILVQVSSSITSLNLTISDTDAKPSSESKYANDNLQFMVSNNDYEDVAYAIFRKGEGLNKINHRNAKAPMIYIPQENEDYAIAMMSDDTKMFGLNFKAATMGQYTLSYKAEGNFDYLHVIDRLTGADVDMLIEGNYTFVATPNDNENRFIVQLAYKPDYSEGNNDIFAYQTGSEILVSGSGELQIFDVTGRMIMNTNINGAEAINVTAQGVYILRLVGTEVKTQKIVVR